MHFFNDDSCPTRYNSHPRVGLSVNWMECVGLDMAWVDCRIGCDLDGQCRDGCDLGGLCRVGVTWKDCVGLV